MKSQSQKISVVIPSRAKNLKLLHNLFSCLEKQSFKDLEIVVVCDRKFTDKERNDFKNEFKNYCLIIKFFSHKNSSFMPHSE
jgi:glycosyltransferase involved in cell wall biosynthesis